MGQPAAHDGGLLRRGRGRRRRRDRAAVRRRAGPARLVRPPDRPQHPEPAGRGGAPGPRPRPGRRLLVRRVADRVARAGGLGLVHRDRAGRRPGRGAGLRPGARPDRRRLGRPRRSGSPPARTRSPASASSPTWPRSCPRGSRPPRPLPSGGLPRVRAAQEFEALRDAADAPAERPTVFLATIGPIARHTARASFAANLFQAGGLATPSGDGASAGSPTRGRRSPASAAPTRTTPTSAAGLAAAAEGGRRHAGVAGRQAGPRRGRRRRLRVRRMRRPRGRCAPSTSRLHGH